MAKKWRVKPITMFSYKMMRARMVAAIAEHALALEASDVSAPRMCPELRYRTARLRDLDERWHALRSGEALPDDSSEALPDDSGPQHGARLMASTVRPVRVRLTCSVCRADNGIRQVHPGELYAVRCRECGRDLPVIWTPPAMAAAISGFPDRT